MPQDREEGVKSFVDRLSVRPFNLYYRRNNRPFRVIYATITSMIAGLPLRLASRPRFSASCGRKRGRESFLN
jgi:hypothetical protein